MKLTTHRWIVVLLLADCSVNSFFLLPHAYKAASSYWTVRDLPNVERRILQRGDWYRVPLAVGNQIPFNAIVRLVSPAPPWYLAYYFYPRLLKMGSTVLGDRHKVRRQYPGDWVLVYSETGQPEMTAYPPLKSVRSPKSEVRR